MSEFKVIETQEELDAILGERIKRAKESVRKEYAEYETYKQAYENQEALKKSHEEQMAELTNKHTEALSTIEGLNSKIAQYETDSVKKEACEEFGLPLAMAGRLHGATKEEIFQDASTLSAFVKPNSAPPLRDPESRIEDGVTSAFKKLNPNIKI